MPAVQSNYSQYHDALQLGKVADTRYKEVRSMIWEGPSTLKFGRAVIQGSADNGVVVGAGGVFRGISLAQKVLDPMTTTDEFDVEETIGCMHKGAVVVEATVNVAAGDPVHYTATGEISNTGGTEIVGATFETSAQAGELAIVYMQQVLNYATRY